MVASWSKYADKTNDNNLSPRKLFGPGLPMTKWRAAHPDGDPIKWQRIEVEGAWLLRFHGGPFLIDQFDNPHSHEVYGHGYQSVVGGYPALAYMVSLTKAYKGGAEVQGDFTIFTIDTPHWVPRTAVRPRAVGDRFSHGYLGVKDLGDPEFDKLFHVQADDEGFARALLSPSAREMLKQSELARHLGFVFEGTTLSTWNRGAASYKTWVDDYPSMMVDYLVRIIGSTPAELWRGER
ncbi:MAG TPA: hypothetical protein VHX38_35620 [Pseudonocardiaceae bacterium]|jgi:hypothetical protein|nr:hypothetical protein [Pseudonocardiaceae bacterium]